MHGSIIIVILVTLIILTILTTIGSEAFCGCAGLGWQTPKPTYYVYRPTGDVSDYGSSAPPTIYAEQNLGWRTGMPYDYFVDHMKSNNWAAGSDPNPSVNSSVPYFATENLSATISNLGSNGGYMKNYGSACGASSNNMTMMAPFTESIKFVTGASGYPNMLSDGSPEFEGPAGRFTEPGYSCPSANAYNLGVGVL